MAQDFFDEETEEKFPENQTQRNPAPSVSSGKREPSSPKRERKFRWWHIVTALCIAVFSFFGGYMVSWSTLDEEIKTLLSVKKRIQRDYYKEVTDEAFYEAVFGGINENLLDAYSQYMTPEEYAAAVQDLKGNRSGIGLVFHAEGENQLRVVRVCGNSPAESAGILAGEKIVGCGSTAESLTACVTFDEFSALLEGYAEKETFFIGVQSATGEHRVLSISKQAYVENYVFYRTATEAYTFTGEQASELTQKGTPMTYLPADTAYIQLVQFAEPAKQEFDSAMNKFKADGKKHLVLDLRDNGGGYLNVMQSIASYFCKNATEGKPVVAIADYEDRNVSYNATGNVYWQYFAEDSRIYVLADSGTASASECLIGCMLDYGTIGYGDICLATRYGVTRTYGKGIMQETDYVDIFKKDALKLTTAEIRWPKGNSIHGRGILPEDGTKTVAQGESLDQETQAALTALFG